MTRDIRIALIICRSYLNMPAKNIAVMEEWTDRAAQAGAEIVCFPELNITGYPSAGTDVLSAETIPGKTTRQMENLAQKHDVTILAGMAETADDGMFISHVVVGQAGLLGIYRKIHLGPSERSRFSAGSRVAVFCVHDFTFGIQLCYDSHFPGLSTAMALKGVDAIFIPHASPKKSLSETPDTKFASWSRHLPARAYDNSIFIAAVNQVGDNGCGLDFPGVAMVVDPSGNICGKYVSESPGMLVFDLEKSALDHVRNHRMRYFLPNRRPDLY